MNNQKVFQFKDVIRFIKKNEKSGINLLSDNQKEDYLIKMLRQCNMSVEVKEKHISDVKMLQHIKNK